MEGPGIHMNAPIRHMEDDAVCMHVMQTWIHILPV